MAILMPFCKTAVGKMGEGHVVHHSRKFSCGRLRGASRSDEATRRWRAGGVVSGLRASRRRRRALVRHRRDSSGSLARDAWSERLKFDKKTTSHGRGDGANEDAAHARLRQFITNFLEARHERFRQVAIL